MPVTNPFYYKMSNGVRITVRPTFLAGRSRPWAGEFVFTYAVRIENQSGVAARLMSRRWVIRDSNGEETIVEGEGVVGQQPLINSGAVHEYESFCVLKSREGHMEGQYFFVRPDGSTFSADIPRFELQAE